MLWIIAAGLVLLAGAGGGAAWYFWIAPARSSATAQPREAPLPFTLAIKPFVISVPGKSGAPRFVQLGVSLELPGSSAGEVVTAVLPQVQDAMRQTVLGFKSDDLQSPDGINRVREAMLKQVNEALTRVLGEQRIAQLTDGRPAAALVQNIYFATLIVE